MKITPHHLAALADAAVPGLVPIGVHVVAENVGEHFHVGFVIDDRERAWVVRVPGDPVSAALQDSSIPFLEEVARFLPFDVPAPAGVASLSDGRRAMVYPYLHGRIVDFALLPAGPGIATGIGEALAALHDVPVDALDETGVPVYDAGECRHRLISDIDRGARTRLVPPGLLARWEHLLDDVSWWRFATVPVHGYLSNAHLLADFPTEDTSSGHVSALVSWEGAKIGDPAEDLAALARSAPGDAVDTVFGAYAQHRREPVDPHLRERARLLGELRLLSRLLSAHSRGDEPAVEHTVRMMRRLLEDLEDDVPPTRSSGDAARGALPVSFEEEPADEDWYSSTGDQAQRNSNTPGTSSLDTMSPETTSLETTSLDMGRTSSDTRRETVAGDRSPDGGHSGDGRANDGYSGGGRADGDYPGDPGLDHGATAGAGFGDGDHDDESGERTPGSPGQGDPHRDDRFGYDRRTEGLIPPRQ